MIPLNVEKVTEELGAREVPVLAEADECIALSCNWSWVSAVFTTDSIGAEQLGWVKLMTAFVTSSTDF